jgi:hypothetical protein
MKPIIISTILLIGFFTISNQGNCTPSSKVTIRNLPLFTGDEVNSAPNSIPLSPPHLNPPSTDDYIGEVDTVGTTWWDMQHVGTCGRMICVDDSDWIHVCWTNMLGLGPQYRYVYYNVKFPGSPWEYSTTGVTVCSYYSGSCTIDVNNYSYPFVAYGVLLPQWQYSQVAVNAPTFPPSPLLSICPPVPNVSMSFPKIVLDSQNRIQLINTGIPLSGVAGDTFAIYYCRGGYTIPDSIYFIEQIEVAPVMTVAADIAASRYSDRVAFVYTRFRPTLQGDTTQYNNDICLVISEDGITWDFNQPINITQFIPPDLALLPDTLAADKDTLRAYTDASILFDRNNNIHVAFTVAYFDEIGGYISVNNSQIWHWSEATGYFSLVANGWFDGDHRLVNSCGAWQRYVQRPCLSEDENTGDLFIVYQQYDPFTVGANGYPQGEIIVSRSTSGGTYWSVGTNVSNTGVDSAEAGECWSERDITCNELVVNDSLHLLYILDRDAGSVIQTPQEGIWTQNPVQYQAIPIDQISATPLMPVCPMHVDSTCMPPVLGVETNDNAKVPSTFHLSQNYPNPFNSITMIDFDLNRTDHLTLKVYNILGQEVATLVNGDLSAGTYRVSFDASSLSSGIYFYRLTSSFQSETQKMVVLK